MDLDGKKAREKKGESVGKKMDTTCWSCSQREKRVILTGITLFPGLTNKYLLEINRDRPGLESTGCQFRGFWVQGLIQTWSTNLGFISDFSLTLAAFSAVWSNVPLERANQQECTERVFRKKRVLGWDQTVRRIRGGGLDARKSPLFLHPVCTNSDN
jgi:hypothetical protein